MKNTKIQNSKLLNGNAIFDIMVFELLDNLRFINKRIFISHVELFFTPKNHIISNVFVYSTSYDPSSNNSSNNSTETNSNATTTKKKRTSTVWGYFKEHNVGSSVKYVCHIPGCSRIFSMTTSTSTLSKHLKVHGYFVSDHQ